MMSKNITLFTIKTPIWKTRSVGLAESKMRTDFLQVQILYKDKYGKHLYPDSLYISTDDAQTYPVQIVKNVRLRIIPIADFKRSLNDITQEQKTLF